MPNDFLVVHSYIPPISLSKLKLFFTVKYIKQVDGLVGCYRGLGPKVFGTIISSIGSEKIAIKLGFERIPDDSKDESELSEEES